MTDKRNIVIKVKYPVAGKSTANSAPKMISQWNIKRILLAAGALLFVLSTLIYVISADQSNIESDNTELQVKATQAPVIEIKDAGIKKLTSSGQAAETHTFGQLNKQTNKKAKPNADILPKTFIKKQLAEKTNKEHVASKINPSVARALLTYAIKNKEPTSEIVRVVDVDLKKPVWVYYFTELKAMKGSEVYHEWLKNGVLVSRQAVMVKDDSWRTSSRKLLSDSEKGKWMVRLVDKNGRLLNEKNFKVE